MAYRAGRSLDGLNTKLNKGKVRSDFASEKKSNQTKYRKPLGETKSVRVVTFVIGPPCAGKSTYIKNNFQDAIVIDLWDFQKDISVFTMQTVADSYQKVLEALVEAIKEHPDKDIVLEHTLLREIRRRPYIKAVKEITDSPINCVAVKPDLDTYKEFCKQRKCNFSQDAMDMLEIPTIEEGFSIVVLVNPKT